MDKLLRVLSPGKTLGLGAALMTVAGWISQMHFATEEGQIAQLAAYVVLALAILAVIGLAHYAPSPRGKSDD